MEDPRSKNKIFAASSVTEYFNQYIEALHQSLRKIDPKSLESAFAVIREAVKRGNRIYVAGNGGSASISDHLCCDWMKGTRAPGSKPLKAHSLVGNVAVFSAFANDYGYENSFSEQLDILGEKGDVVVLISSSGNSPNVIRAAKKAKEKEMNCISFTGFSGGTLRELSDVNVYVEFNNYGIVEDGHQAVMHCLSQYLALLADQGNLASTL